VTKALVICFACILAHTIDNNSNHASGYLWNCSSCGPYGVFVIDIMIHSYQKQYKDHKSYGSPANIRLQKRHTHICMLNISEDLFCIYLYCIKITFSQMH